MNSNYDLDSNLDYVLNKSIEDIIGTDYRLQDKILNSKDFNITFKYIEDSLNFLYEKNRILQDIITYAETFLHNEITSNITKCKKILQSIEKDRDLIKDKTYIKISVPFDFDLKTISDRDNTILPTANLCNNSLMMNKKNSTTYSIDNMTVKNSSNCLFTNAKRYFTLNNYRSLYAADKISSKNISEIITLQFKSPIKINRIHINTSNCYIAKVTASCDNKNKQNIDINSLELFESIIVDELNITISTKNYCKSQLSYNKIKNTDINKIIDSINSDQDQIKDNDSLYYYYLFGIDEIEIQNIEINNVSSFCSKNINIGSLSSNDHLSLYTEDSIERGSIEYYILNGDEEIPILPENQNEIINEKIFYKTATRFPINYNKPVIIKKDLKKTNLTLQEAINMNDEGTYTVSYTPVINTITNSLNENIKLKAILRSYDTNFNTFIRSLKIKKYGGNNLWTE